MPGLVPGIPLSMAQPCHRDGRDKPGHDGSCIREKLETARYLTTSAHCGQVRCSNGVSHAW